MKRIGVILLFIISGYALFAQSWVWGREASAIKYNSGTEYEAWGVAADKQGNAYVTGYGIDSILFGTDSIYNLFTDMFLVKYDSLGNIQWAATPMATGEYAGSSGYAVTTDNNGNIYVTGGFHDTVTFGTYQLTSPVYYPAYAIFCPYIVKYAPNGSVLWAKQAISSIPNGSGATGATDIATDASGNIYVTGTFYGTLSFGLTALNANTYAVFTVKYDANGNVIWAQQSTENNNAYSNIAIANSITADASDNVYVTGYYIDGTGFGSYKLTDNVEENVFLVKYSSGGNVLWAQQPIINYSTDSGNEGTSVATDNAGNVYVTGSFVGTLTFGSYILTVPNPKKQSETFLVKYAPNGNIIWAKQSQNEQTFPYGNDQTTMPMVATDKKNDIFMELLADTSNFTFGGYSFTIPASGYEQMRLGTVCMAKLDTSGKVICASVYANPANYFVNSYHVVFATNIGIATDDSGKYIYITEDNFDDTLVFNKDSLIAGYNYLPFLARWQPCQSSNGGGGGGGGSDTNQSSNPNQGDCHNLFVPDVFTPDGAYNNIFYVRGVCIQSLDKFLVFDRWGNKIFESRSLNDGWNGTYGGHPMNTGTYIWYAKVTFQDGTTTEVKGNVTLLR